MSRFLGICNKTKIFGKKMGKFRVFSVNSGQFLLQTSEQNFQTDIFKFFKISKLISEKNRL